jgi:hypothetical protein
MEIVLEMAKRNIIDSRMKWAKNGIVEINEMVDSRWLM